jgi:hypothetical protein
MHQERDFAGFFFAAVPDVVRLVAFFDGAAAEDFVAFLTPVLPAVLPAVLLPAPVDFVVG